MTTDERLEALSNFTQRCGWEVSSWTASQREPTNGVTVVVQGLTLRSESSDSLDVALARMELVLQDIAGKHGDIYLHEPHRYMGRLSSEAPS